MHQRIGSLVQWAAILLAAGCILGIAQAGPTPYPDPHDQSDWPGKGPIRVFDWMKQNREYFWTQREKAQGAVVLVGDSLAGNWKTVQKDFPGLNVANRGIGGDTTRGILFRFQEDVLDLQPRAVVLCAGTNDLSAHAEPSVIMENITSMLDQARESNPALPVILCTVPPRDHPKAPLKSPDALADLNARIRELGESKQRIVVLDLFAALATPEGGPQPECFREDRLHLSEAGYKKWAEVLAPALEQAGVKP